MSRRLFPLLGVAAVAALLLVIAPSVRADEELGQMRVQRMDGSWIVGDVTEQQNAYRIKMGQGITVTLRKNEVRQILPLEEAVSSPGDTDATSTNSLRRYIEDEEIDELLADIDISEEDIAVKASEMSDELEADEAAIEEMCRLAGVPNDEEHVLRKPHFVLVYTSDKTAATKLASRLESVFRWNLQFLRMINVPFTRPEYKLEIFYFGTYREFDAYSINIGHGPTGGGILGFFSPDLNRSAFFDLESFPPLARILEQAKDKRIPFKDRQHARNTVNRWVDFKNLEVIQHEAGHHIHFNIGLFSRDLWMEKDPRDIDLLPRWLVEGTTMMFELPPTRAGASLGTVNHYRLNDFRRLYNARQLNEQFLKHFMLDNSEFLRGGGYYYPLAWSLVNYFWREKRDGYAHYAQLISEREPGQEVSYTERERELEECFGRIDEDWVKDFVEFVDSLNLKKSVLPPELHP